MLSVLKKGTRYVSLKVPSDILRNCRQKVLCAYESRVLRVSQQEKCQSLVRLIVAAATDSTRLLLSYTLGDEPFRQLALDLVNLVLVSLPSFFVCAPEICLVEAICEADPRKL